MTVELADLERALAELADSLEFPAASDMPERVIAELDRPASVTPLVQRPAVRRVLALAAAAIVIAGVVLVASPRARKAVADLLGIGGVAIRTSDTTPAIPPTTLSTSPSSSGSTVSTPSSASLDGGSSRLDRRRGRASAIGVAPPLPASLGPPQTVTLADGRLTLEWPPSTILPATDLPGSARCSRSSGVAEEPLLEKAGTGNRLRAGQRRRAAGRLAERRFPRVDVPRSRRPGARGPTAPRRQHLALDRRTPHVPARAGARPRRRHRPGRDRAHELRTRNRPAAGGVGGACAPGCLYPCRRRAARQLRRCRPGRTHGQGPARPRSARC